MTSAVYARTPNLGLGLLEFNFPNWGDDENTNMKIIDAGMSVIGFQIEGAWMNSTVYALGDLVVDTDLNSLWRCMIGHTSAATGTFAQDRTANPTYWIDASQSLHARGQWTTATHYYINDVVYKDANKYSWALVTREYVSSVSYDTDVANANLVIITDTTSAWTQFVSKGGDTMSGALTIPVTPTAVGHATSKQYVDNGLALKLNISAYTAADVLAKLITVDGAGSNLDADLLDGQQGAFYLPAGTYTAADILAKLLTVDGAGSGLDADLLDGNSSAFYQSASNLNTGILPAARFDDTAHGSRGGGALHALATAAVAGFLLDAPSDGTSYARRNAAWIATSAFVDAPSDGSFYGRVNATWVVGASKTYIDNADAAKVTGPAGATDNALARFDLATGKIIQNGNVIEDDSGNLSGIAGLSMSGTATITGGVVTGAVTQSVTNSSMSLYGGTGASAGARIFLFGPTYAGGASYAYQDAAQHFWRDASGASNRMSIDGSGNVVVANAFTAGSLNTGGQALIGGSTFHVGGITAAAGAGNLIFGGSVGSAIPLWLRPVWNVDNGFSVSAAGDCQIRGNGTNLTFANGPGSITCTGVMSMQNVYNQTTATAANVNVDSAGGLRRSTSSRRYKKDIVDYPKGLADLLKLRPITYKPLESEDHQAVDQTFAGLLAEDVDEAGLTEFVEYDTEGRPDGLYYPHMVALLINTISELTTRIEALEAR